jgi:hypothetical protein
MLPPFVLPAAKRVAYSERQTHFVLRIASAGRRCLRRDQAALAEWGGAERFVLREQVLERFLFKGGQDLVCHRETLSRADAKSRHSCRFDRLDTGVGILNPQAVPRWCVHETSREDEDIRCRFPMNDTIAIGDAIKGGHEVQPLQHGQRVSAGISIISQGAGENTPLREKKRLQVAPSHRLKNHQ